MDSASQPTFNPESFRDSLADALAPDGSLTLEPETKIRILSVWDSIASVSIVAMVYADYDVQISGEELMGCETVSAVSDLVAEKLAASQ